jgi:hypothetical protein
MRRNIAGDFIEIEIKRLRNFGYMLTEVHTQKHDGRGGGGGGVCERRKNTRQKN